MKNEKLLHLILGCDFNRKDIKPLLIQILSLAICIIIASLLS
jgi:hypothetical protein